MEENAFEAFIKKVCSHLCCNMTDEQHRNEYGICYDYTEDQVKGNLHYFKDCYESGMSAYKALLYFHDYLVEQEYLKRF